MIAPENIERINEALDLLKDQYSECRLCPWDCRVNRLEGEMGPCAMGPHAILAAAAIHMGEEPPISGTRGIGNLFFAGCPMHCVYCQNYQISQKWRRLGLSPSSPMKIALKIKELHAKGVHAIGLVSASHVLPSVLEALKEAARLGVRLPVVYNTSSFERVEILKVLKGIVDVYLADLRYSDEEEARKYSKVRGYVWASRTAILEMARQVGSYLERDSSSLAKRGLLIRVLVLPNDIAGVTQTLEFIKENLGTQVTLSLMAQYTPMFRAHRYPLLARKVFAGEYLRALETAEAMGFEDVFVQSLDAADYYVPDFSPDGVEFRTDSSEG